MINKTTLTALYLHMEWADAAPGAAQADARLPKYLYHLRVTQCAFLRIWRGEPRETLYPAFNDAWSLMQWARSYHSEAFAYLEAQSDAKLSAPMRLPRVEPVKQRSGRAPKTTTPGETALQVVLHSMYHRGQANAHLRKVGGEPPLVDSIAWI